MPEPDRTNKLKYGEYLVTLAVSANITPDPQTGIGRWTEQDFLDRFYQYREYIEKGSPAVGLESFTLMPLLNFAQLTL